MSNEQVRKVYVLTWGYSFKSDGKDIISPEHIFVFETESMAIEAIKEQVKNNINIMINNFLNIAQNYSFGVRNIVAKWLKQIKETSVEPESLNDFNKFIYYVPFSLDDMLDEANRAARRSTKYSYSGTVFAELVSCFDIMRKPFYSEEDCTYHNGHYNIVEKIVDAFEIKDEQQVNMDHLDRLIKG